MSEIKKIYSIQSQFSSAHFYNNQSWSLEKNQQNFGRCFTQYGHGHNYKLELSIVLTTIESNIENQLSAIKASVDSITSQLDHEHLNFVIPFFKTHIPTTENIGLYLIDQLKKIQHHFKITQLKLYEMPDLWIEVQL